MRDEPNALYLGMFALILSRVETGAWAALWGVMSVLFVVGYWVEVWLDRKQRRGVRR